MATIKAIAIYEGGGIPDGTELQGEFLIGVTDQDYASGIGGYQWYGTPDLDPGYLITLRAGAEPSFWRSSERSNISFLNLFNSIANRLGTDRVLSASAARMWVADNNGYYTGDIIDTEEIEAVVVAGTDEAGTETIYNVFDATNGTVQTIDTGLGSRWQIYNIIPLDESGFLIIANYKDSPEDYELFFITSNGTLVENYSIQGERKLQAESLDGQWIYVIAGTNQTFKYFNGAEVFTFNYDSETTSVDIPWWWDATDGTGGFNFRTIVNETTMNIYWVSSDGTTILRKTYDSTQEIIEVISYSPASFILYLYRDISGNVNALEICNPDGTLLREIDFSINVEYNNFDFSFYGENMFYLAIWSNIIEDPYRIINYDGNTNILIDTSHQRGANYYSLSSYTNDGLTYQRYNVDVNNCYVAICDGFNGYYGPYSSVNYLDFVYFITGDSSERTHTFTDGIMKGIAINYAYQANSFFIPIEKVNNDIGILTLGESGANELTIGNIQTAYNYAATAFGAKFMFIIYNDPEPNTVYIINQDGTLLQSTSFNGAIDYYINYDTIYIKMNESGFYLNSVTNILTNVDSYGSIFTPSWYKEKYNSGAIILVNFKNSIPVRVLTRTGISPIFNLPVDDGSLQMAKDFFVYCYTLGGIQTIAVYDFNGSILNSLEINNRELVRLNAVENRVIGRVDGEGIYFISPTTIEKVLMTDMRIVYNDYLWWAD